MRAREAAIYTLSATGVSERLNNKPTCCVRLSSYSQAEVQLIGQLLAITPPRFSSQGTTGHETCLINILLITPSSH